MISIATWTQVALPFPNLHTNNKFRPILCDSFIMLYEGLIKDGFVIIATKEDGKRIMEHLKHACSFILTYDMNLHKTIFLDLVVYKGARFQKESCLNLKTYLKPANRMLYLFWVSKSLSSNEK